jgi:hypothetical protein
MRLSELEFLSQLDGKTYDGLSRNMQRRILETQITVYLIERDTQPEVKFNVFKRINTGGLPLSPQEIRHALNQGHATKLLKRLAETNEFKRATGGGINPKRMGDRECVLRFLAFTMTSPEKYSTKDFDSFLNAAMQNVNKMSEEERNSLDALFRGAMTLSAECFGGYAFRKRYRLQDTYKYPINKALFEVWSVNLARLAPQEIQRLSNQKKRLQHDFCELMSSDRDFESAISQGTGDPGKVRLRFGEIRTLVSKVLND